MTVEPPPDFNSPPEMEDQAEVIESAAKPVRSYDPRRVLTFYRLRRAVRRHRAMWNFLVCAVGLLVGVGLGILCTAAFHPNILPQYGSASGNHARAGDAAQATTLPMRSDP